MDRLRDSRPAPLLRQYGLLAWMAGIFALKFPAPALLALAAICFSCLPRPRLLLCTALVCLSFGLGLGYAHLRQMPEPANPDWLVQAETPPPVPSRAPDSLYRKGLRLAGQVLEVNGLPDRRLRVRLAGLRPVEDQAAPALPGCLIWTWEKPALSPGQAFPLPGQRLELTLKPRPVRGLSNPELMDNEEYWAERGVRHRAWSRGDEAKMLVFGEPWAEAAWRARLKTLFEAALPDDRAGQNPGSALLPALIFGDRFLLDNRVMDLFTRGTIIHSLALSGLHLAYVASLGYGLAWLLGRIFPRLCLGLPRQKFGVLLALPPAFFYLWLGGAQPSLLRSFLMLLFCGILLWRNKPKIMLDALLWALLVILLWNPAALFDLSLQLSALSIAAIALFAPQLPRLADRIFPRKVRRPLPRRLLRLGRAVFYTLGISAIVQAGLLPLLLSSFGSLGLNIFLNLIWLPVLGFVTLPMAFAALVFVNVPPLAQALLHLACLPCNLLLGGLAWLDQAGLLPAPAALRPHWLAAAGFYLLALNLPAFLSPIGRPSTKNTLAACCAFVLLCAPVVARLHESDKDFVRLRLLDVGQGQAVVLDWRGGRALVDGGGFFSSSYDIGKNLVAPILSANQPPRLDVVINTHPDSDHLQGLLYVLRSFDISAFADNGAQADSKTFADLARILASRSLPRITLKAGQFLDLSPDLRLEALNPPAWEQDARRLGGNNASLFLRLVWRGQGLALLGGDVENAALAGMLKELAKSGRPDALKTQVLILPHHGSAGSLNPVFYAAAAPHLALASTGYANQWGFPAAPVREALDQLGVPLLNTADQGQIVIEWQKPEGAFSVRTARQLASSP